MKRPMLGILVVSILQIGFVAYTTLDGSPDVSAIAPVRETVLTPAAMGDQADDAIVVYRSGPPSFVNTEPKRDPMLDVPRIKQTARSGTRIAPVRRDKVLLAQDAKLPADHPIVPYGYASVETGYVGQSERPKKRSFFSKAVSVVKKPYDWTRSALERLP